MDNQPISVLVGICTAQRPKMLRACLVSLASQDVPDYLTVQVVVVDNESAPNNYAAVEALTAEFPFPLAYVHEPCRGIPQARNRVLEFALSCNVDWIAFIDDDEIAEPDWLSQMVRATRRYGCDVVQGQVFQFAHGDEPSKLNPKRSWSEGKKLRHAITDNVIFRAWLVWDTGLNLRFDERLALSGGTDVLFFAEARKSGAEIVCSLEPVVYEQLMPDRLGVMGRMKRQFSYCITSYERELLEEKADMVSSYKFKRVLWAFRDFFTGLSKLITGSVVILLARERGLRKLKKGTKKVLKFPALLAFLCGVRYERYRKISGA